MNRETGSDMSGSTHLSEVQLVAFLENALGDEQPAIELHLAICTECRDELVAVSEILQPGRRRRKVPWKILAPTAAAAAAILLYAAGPLVNDAGPEQLQHRDAPELVSDSPIPTFPVGTVGRVRQLVWRSVAPADRYRITLYDGSGEVLWKSATADTFAPLPDTLILHPGSVYLWRLEARVGWDLWEASDLAEFSIEDQKSGTSDHRPSEPGP